MMSTRKVDALTAAIRANFAKPVSGNNKQTTKTASGQTTMTRSTFSAPPEAIVALRILALRSGCTMNDLLLLAIDQLFNSVGEPCTIVVNDDLFDRIKTKVAGPKNGDVVHSDNGRPS
jgi:hypothetical protein